ncbi:hypothetical protein LAD12857_45440 [Lacrimispora amygdalina]|uniref:Shikimate kinase n=1 Tax=Lacrimispora amygdalina TaxID=253257 RepID=A0A3E2NCX3_9FIRM|nr:shikimate kinase [Clostridium indicum]RFZ78845.1 dephospho-CoA kinase [Clostridium indicum]
MRELKEIRNDLNQYDLQILELLMKRFSCIGEIIEYKKAFGLPILQPEQEDAQQETLIRAMGKHGCKEELLGIFRQIMEESKRVQSRNLFHYNIALIGFMGSGKSTVSKCLKDMLAMNEVDVDTRIVEDQKMPIKDIFAEYGEEYFRNCESSAIISLKDCRQTIISCGGGAVIREENVKNLKKNSRIVLLTASPETILERVKDSDERPILNGNMNVEYIKGLMERRAGLYKSAADIIIETDGKNIVDICEELIQSLMKLESAV